MSCFVWKRDIEGTIASESVFIGKQIPVMNEVNVPALFKSVQKLAGKPFTQP
jgi:hypothetical protein